MAHTRDEPVRLTRIYTRGGDGGATSLGDGSRVAKTDPRVEVLGTLDELNSQLGLVLAAEPGERIHTLLARLQNELFDLGADVSVPLEDQSRPTRLRIEEAQVEALERDCDALNAELEPLMSFVLPGGPEAAARLHVARAVCRRAERRLWALDEAEPVNEVALRYLNRLGDLLFILARTADEGEEPLWKPGATRAPDAGE